MEAVTIAVISAIIALLSAVGSLVSAKTAEKALDESLRQTRLQQIRDVISAAQSCIAESVRVDGLGNRLKRELTDLSVFAGRHGAEEGRIKDIEQHQTAAGKLQNEARIVVEERKQMYENTSEELTDILVRFEGYVIQLSRVKETFQLDLESTSQQVQTFREKALKGSNP